MGKDYKKLQEKQAKEVEKTGLGLRLVESKPRPAMARRDVDQDSEDETGRSALGKRKRSYGTVADQHIGDAKPATVQEIGTEEARTVFASSRSRRPTSYLDEVLAERARKHGNKAKKRKKHKASE